MNTERFYQLIFSVGSAVVTALSPTLPYILLCTAAVLMDCWTAWQLDKRVRKAYPEKTSKNSGKFKSSHFGSVLITLLQVYMLLIFAHFLYIYVTESLSFNALKLAAGLVIGWQLWSCLENISSCNGAKWALILQQVMVDKTERHFDIDLSALRNFSGRRPDHLGDGKGTPMNNGRPRPSTLMDIQSKPAARVVILGTAHGSNVPGKRSPDGKFREYRFSREVISALKPKLEAKGFTVFVDMPADEVPSPQAKELSLRCKYVNGICKTFGNDNCIYVSIHVNAAGSESKWLNASGFSVFVCNNCSAASKRLAQSLYAEAAARGLQGNRSVPTCRYWSANFYVLRNTDCPAVLTENLFMDNRADVELLSSDEGKAKVVDLHLQGILKFLKA